MSTAKQPAIPFRGSSLVEAFIRAQKEIEPNPFFDMEANTGKFKYPYLSLGKVLAIVREACGKNDIAIQQFNDKRESDYYVVTRLIHASGEAQDYFTPMFGVGTGPQDFGKAYTYARRYALYGIFGIYGEEDDDAGSITPPRSSAPRATPVDRDEKRELLAKILAGMGNDMGRRLKALKHYEVKDLSDMTVEQMQDCVYQLSRSEAPNAIN